MICSTEDRPRRNTRMRNLEDNALLLLVIAVSLAFAWILWPFYEAILWATVLAIVFAPLYRRLSITMRQQHSLAALATVLIVVTMVILPLTLIAAALVQEATNLYEKIESNQLDFGRFFQEFLDALPAWATDLLNRFGLTNLGAIHERLSAALLQGSKYLAAQALSIGKGTANFIVSLLLMLYLLFFFLRDGGSLSRRIRDAIPLREEQQRALFTKFAVVTRAMFKGNLLVAAVQGTTRRLHLLVPGDPRPRVMGRGDGLPIFAARGRRRRGLATGRYLFSGDRRRMAGPRSDCLRRVRHWTGRQLAAPLSRRQRHPDARLRCADLHAGRHRDFRSGRSCHGAGDRGDVHCRLGLIFCIEAEYAKRPHQ